MKSITLATFLVTLLCACGGDEVDPAPTADASTMPTGVMTSCGVRLCDFDTEICVRDANQREACVAVPSGCTADRACATCASACTAGRTCGDVDPANMIACT